MHIKAKTLHILYAKKLKIVQNQEKSLWCILKSAYDPVAAIVQFITILLTPDKIF